MTTATLTSPVAVSGAKVPTATDVARPQRVAGECKVRMRDGAERP